MDPIKLEALTASVLRDLIERAWAEDKPYSLELLSDTVAIKRRELLVAHHHSLSYISEYFSFHKGIPAIRFPWPEGETRSEDYIAVLEAAIRSQLEKGAEMTDQVMKILYYLALNKYGEWEKSLKA